MQAMLDLNTLLNGVAVALLLWQFKSLQDVRERVAHIEGQLRALQQSFLHHHPERDQHQ